MQKARFNLGERESGVSKSSFQNRLLRLIIKSYEEDLEVVISTLV